MPDLNVYMAPDEFAALPAAVHHAVWAAYAAGRIAAEPWQPSATGSAYVYNRAQVLELLAETAVTRG